jgi:type II secretion system protein I
MIARRPHGRQGLTLLEVILAVAVLGGCVAVIGELVRIGTRHAEEAREISRAQLVCESKLEELAAGAAPLESVASAPLETDGRWLYSVSVSTLDRPELLEVRVTVQPSQTARRQPLSVSLVRWMIDPALMELIEEGEMPEDNGEDATDETTDQTGEAGPGGLDGT